MGVMPPCIDLLKRGLDFQAVDVQVERQGGCDEGAVPSGRSSSDKPLGPAA
jgi:hypothetical protein